MKKKNYFEEKIAGNNNNIPKELWRNLKSLSMPSKVGGNLKY